MLGYFFESKFWDKKWRAQFYNVTSDCMQSQLLLTVWTVEHSPKQWHEGRTTDVLNRRRMLYTKRSNSSRSFGMFELCPFQQPTHHVTCNTVHAYIWIVNRPPTSPMKQQEPPMRSSSLVHQPSSSGNTWIPIRTASERTWCALGSALRRCGHQFWISTKTKNK